jgi:Cu/Ag efflux pump CusA
MDVYSGAMASPMLVRGTQNTTGRTFNMMILAVEEHDILDRQRLSKYHEKSTSAVETWISNITAITRKISSVILGVVVCFHILALIFKIKGLPMGLFAPLATTILESLHPIMALTLLTDPLLLRSLLTASYLQVAGMLGTRQNVDRFLAVEQLFLNEESICKYDSLVPRKVVLIDLPEPVDIRLLPALKP